MSVGEYCNREVMIVTPEASIREAARLMRRYHVGDVVVVDESEGVRRPVGILTDRDIVVELIGADIDIDAVTVGDVMSFDLTTARADEDVAETVDKMCRHGVRRIPVVDVRGGLVGIVTLDDYFEVLAEQVGDLVQIVTRQDRIERERRI